MLVSNRRGLLKVGGDRGCFMITSNMGNGTKFKLSSVLPNVFSKIKGIRKGNSLHKLPSSSSVISECASFDIDQKDFSTMSRDSHGGSSPASPVRTFPQNRNGDVRHSSSPVHGQKSHDIRLPVESPIRSKGGNKSGPLSPPTRVKSAADMVVDPGCCSYDSTMALVPHDARVRRVAPQAFSRCLLMNKCNSFNGSTHSDSEVSETDSSTAHGRIRHSRAMSVPLEGSSCEGYGLLSTAADERASQRSGKVSIPHRSTERRDQNANIVDRSHQLYGGSSPIQAVRNVYSNSNAVAKYCRSDHTQDSSERRGSAFPNSGRKETGELDHDQTRSRRHNRPSRKLSFVGDDNARVFDEASFSSEDDFYKVAKGNGNLPKGHYRSRSTPSKKKSQLQRKYGGKQDTDPGYKSSEVVYTEGDKNHAAAILRRDALLAKTVLNASDGWVHLSRFSQDEKAEKLTRGAASFDAAEQAREGDSEAVVYSREARLVKTVLNAQGWARENLRALAKANDLDRQNLARLKAEAESLDLLVRREEEADKIEYETFGLPQHSRDFFSKSSRHPSSLGEEVEKYTEGRVDYRSFSPLTNLSKSERILGHEDFAQPVAEYAKNQYKSGRTDRLEKEFAKPWDTEFPSFRSDSVLMGGGIALDRKSIHEERAALIDCTDCEGPGALTPRHSERQRQNKIGVGQQQDFRNGGKVSSRSPSQREEISGGTKNFKLSTQSSSPRPSLPRRSPSAIQEFINGKKLPSSPTPSPVQDISGRRSTSRTASPVQDFQQVKKSSRTPERTPSPARNQSLQAAAKPPTTKAEAGMQRLDSVAVVKASYDPYHDFRESMVEMILENDIRTAEDLEDLLQCYLSLNSSEYHKIIVQVFSDVWGDIFER